jgi:thiamine pyrophosphokinase
MIEPIVRSSDPITLIGGGEATAEDLHKALTAAPVCVAADGGAALAVAQKVDLAALIGDFDSVSEDTLAAVPKERRHHIPEQNSTDFEKALTRIAAPMVLGVGFLGGRIDHQLAVFHSLMAFPDRPCLLIGRTEIICLAPPQITVPTRADDIVSLFPMAPVTGHSDGLAWPIAGLPLAPGVQVGTSNRATGPLSLRMEKPDMLLILPRRLMSEMVALLGRTEAARWPARAG